ncbi:MAG: ABC transporter ATP-binding protein [Planctomycetota bacterium]|nr:MAG: ABC transporter ATP-binding protein [Planctomycetota bacterium]
MRLCRASSLRMIPARSLAGDDSPPAGACMADPLLRIESLRVQFGTLLAVDDVSFELRAGELLGMIGQNGAGKTTTLRAAAGLQPVTTGRIELMGCDVFRMPTRVGRHLAFTPDTPAVYDAITVEEFLQFIGRCYGMTPRRTDEAIDHWLEQLWLTEKRKSKISALSRGMRQRLAVARSLLPDPHVLLMDEPAAGLDPAGRVQFREMLANLRDQGKAIIVSSHILADLAEYCTHVAIMGHGKLVQYGTVAAIAGGDQQERVRYRVVFAEPVGDARSRLERIPHLAGNESVRLADHELIFDYDVDRRAAAELLRQLIEAGFPVAAFEPLTPDLEQAYLRTGIRQVD